MISDQLYRRIQKHLRDSRLDMRSQSNMCHPFIGIIIHVIHSIKIPLIRAFDNYRNHAAYSPGDVVFVNDNDYISS